jgi:hypothetical protein
MHCPRWGLCGPGFVRHPRILGGDGGEADITRKATLSSQQGHTIVRRLTMILVPPLCLLEAPTFSTQGVYRSPGSNGAAPVLPACWAPVVPAASMSLYRGPKVEFPWFILRGVFEVSGPRTSAVLPTGVTVPAKDTQKT